MKKKRSNPYTGEYLWYYLASAIIWVKPYDFSIALNYYYQGEECKDCGEVFDSCICEFCDDCNYRRCICKYQNILYYYNNLSQARKDILKWIKENFNKKDILQIIKCIKSQSAYPYPATTTKSEIQKLQSLEEIVKYLNRVYP